MLVIALLNPLPIFPHPRTLSLINSIFGQKKRNYAPQEILCYPIPPPVVIRMERVADLVGSCLVINEQLLNHCDVFHERPDIRMVIAPITHY